MSDEVYQREILALARDTSAAGSMDTPDGAATIDNPLCGDRVRLELQVVDGQVTAVRHHVRGCLLCEAAAGLIARCAPDGTAADLRAMAATMADYLRGDGVALPERWQAAAAFTPVRPVRNRHRCVTLPFEAALAALDDAGA